MAFRTNKMPVLQNKSASGAIASFDTILTKPLEECTSLITGYQEGSGTPSPSNIRPLVSFSSASLGKCDNNTASLWSIDNSFNGDVEFNQLSGGHCRGLVDTGVTITYDSTSKKFHIENTATATTSLWIDYTDDIPSGHKVLGIISNSNLRVYIGNTLSTTNAVIVISSNERLYFGITIINGTEYNDDFYLNLFDLTAMFGSTIADYIYNLEQTTTGAGVAFFKTLYPEDYYAYNAGTKQLVGDTLATFTFGHDIYQGSIDWKRGVVVGTHLLKDMGSLNWSINGTYTTLCDFRSSSLQGIIKNGTDSVASDINTEIFETVSRNKQIADDVIDSIAVSNTGRLIVYGDINRYPDITTFRSAMNGVYLAYELDTPIEIPLGGINLLTRKGQNNIFADTGDVDLTYKDLDIAKRGSFREVFKLP